MNRRKFLSYVGCSCGGLLLNSCSTAPITERKQLKIIPEAKLNAQAAKIFEKVKEKTKDNPVFYVQYAYARINSIVRTLNISLKDQILINSKMFQPNDLEEKILRKI